MEQYHIISLSGIYNCQLFWKEELEKGISCLTDCTKVPGSLYFCSDEAAQMLRKKIENIKLDCLHFIDSGDYHYMTLFFLERIRKEFTLLVFDHHSDCMESAFGDILTCGSWVLRALSEVKNLKKVILIGPADEDKTGEQILKDPRIIWVKEEEFEEKQDELLEELNEYPVYISFDKDVLGKADALTDWSQGNVRLEEIFSFLDKVRFSNIKLIGMDVCGEAQLNEETLANESINKINNGTNEKIKNYQKRLTFSL